MNYKFYILFLFHTTVFASNDSIFLSKGSGFYESFFLKANSHLGQIVYETDGSEPDNYSKKLNDSLEINETKVIKFGLKINNKIVFKRTCFYLIDFNLKRFNAALKSSSTSFLSLFLLYLKLFSKM